MSIRAVIFDLGGVLVRTEDRATRLELCRQLGLTYEQLSSAVFDSPTAIQATLGEISAESHWKNLLASLQWSNGGKAEFEGLFWGGDSLNTGLVETIRSLRPRYKTALLSNAWDDVREKVIDRWNLLPLFDVVIISAEVRLAKPDPRIYELAVDRLGVKPEEAVFIDDFIDNVKAARDAGLYAIQFINNAQTTGELRSLLEGKRS
ncbi:MAG: HAD family hydrolase [Omnitrophica WOR_2 bacterium]